MLARALIGEYFMKNGNGWFIEMVQADITISEILTFQREKCLAMLQKECLTCVHLTWDALG